MSLQRSDMAVGIVGLVIFGIGAGAALVYQDAGTTGVGTQQFYNVVWASSSRDQATSPATIPDGATQNIALPITDNNVTRISFSLSCTDAQVGTPAAAQVLVTFRDPAGNSTGQQFTIRCDNTATYAFNGAATPNATRTTGANEANASDVLANNYTSAMGKGTWTAVVTNQGATAPVGGQVVNRPNGNIQAVLSARVEYYRATLSAASGK